MRALVVGAGALRQVFGRWLAKGGATTSYLVKPGEDEWPAEAGRCSGCADWANR